VYGRARLGNRWALKEAGYPPDFVEAWTYEPVILITVKPASGKGQSR
jgi:hypothetical protein